MQLILDRPLAFFDLETTGTRPQYDRIVEICVLIVSVDDKRSTHTWRVNPDQPIPSGAAAVHGISDEDVADAPPFAEIAHELYEMLDKCDLAGFNIIRFDVPLLVAEFQRCGIRYSLQDRKLIDCLRIFHKHEPRDLTAALDFYCGDAHIGAHGAEADVRATARILEAQLARYDSLPREVAGLDKYCTNRPQDAVDPRGKLRWKDGQIVLAFGRYRGVFLDQLVVDDPDYVQNILYQDFSDEVKTIVHHALISNPTHSPPPQDDA
jgi:DNA polymerase III subunit epsilon